MSLTVGNQKILALARANEVRVGVAGERRRIAYLSYVDGCRLLAEMLADPSEMLLSARIGWLLLSVRGVGRVKVSPLLNRAGVRSWDRHVRDLSDRQRRLLVEILRESADVRESHS